MRLPDQLATYLQTEESEDYDQTYFCPVPTEPKAANYPPGSAEAFENNNFNYTYTSPLNALYILFNGGNNQTQTKRAIGLMMMSLKGQARTMMAGIINASAPYTGPSFEHQQDNPSR